MNITANNISLININCRMRRHWCVFEMQLTKSLYIEFYVCVYCGLLKKLYTGESVFLVYLEEIWRDFNLFSKS